MANELNAGAVFGVGSLGVLVAGGLITLVMWGCPQYNVYHQRMSGEAALAEAESSKQIAVQSAKAKLESAKMLAEAEVERAKGVAAANKIIGESLAGHEEYLRYLWIVGLENGNPPTIIYVPTEAGLPILEASRFNKNPAYHAYHVEESTHQ